MLADIQQLKHIEGAVSTAGSLPACIIFGLQVYLVINWQELSRDVQSIIYGGLLSCAAGIHCTSVAALDGSAAQCLKCEALLPRGFLSVSDCTLALKHFTQGLCKHLSA